VGRAGDAGAHRGARGGGAGGQRRSPQRQVDVGGRRRASQGARVPTHRRPVQVQVEEPRKPLQGNTIDNPSSGFFSELSSIVQGAARLTVLCWTSANESLCTCTVPLLIDVH